ncbi:armadillo-type protein [Mycena metata]|uniref:Armadillo-type protein n=1 Tax=Mycena metata TaxID=1033252 RepID=A0AAD7E0X2_9AGAR|nr:armadillo-type protein [Mycena metata]
MDEDLEQDEYAMDTEDTPPTHRPSILIEFQGHVLRLLLYRETSSVFADTFELYTNAYERTLLVRDFYGKETALFTVTSGTDDDKERACKGLAGVLEGADPDRRKRVLASMKEALTFIYQDILTELVHTKDGSRVIREFLARGSAKDRKQILKVLKPHVECMCIDNNAQLVLFTALDVIDDIKLVIKTLIPEMTSPAQTLTDNIRAKTSKKTSEVREAEVRVRASEALIKWVKDKCALLLQETAASLVVTEIMLFAEGDKTGAIKTLLRAAWV